MKPNPAYKGKWSAPLIDNPDYKARFAINALAHPALKDPAPPVTRRRARMVSWF